MAMPVSALLDHPLVRRLLKYSATFHGEIIAETLGGTPPEKFFDRGGVAVASVDQSALVFVQRELHDWTVDKKVAEFLTHRLLNFELEDEEDNRMRLQVYCWKTVAGNGMTPRIDLDLLFLNRSGLNVASGTSTDSIPVPLTHFMHRCQAGVFGLLPNAVPDDKLLMPRLRMLADNGWVQEQTAVKFVDGDVPDENCPICHEALPDGPVVVTPCGHHFHASCWSKHVDHSVSRAAPVPEPIRNSPFEFGMQLRGQAIYIACPMCREGMRCIDTMPS